MPCPNPVSTSVSSLWLPPSLFCFILPFSFCNFPQISLCSLSCSTLLYFPLSLCPYSLPVLQPFSAAPQTVPRAGHCLSQKLAAHWSHHFIHLIRLANGDSPALTRDPQPTLTTAVTNRSCEFDTSGVSQSAKQFFKMLAIIQVW